MDACPPCTSNEFHLFDGNVRRRSSLDTRERVCVCGWSHASLIRFRMTGGWTMSVLFSTTTNRIGRLPQPFLKGPQGKQTVDVQVDNAPHKGNKRPNTTTVGRTRAAALQKKKPRQTATEGLFSKSRFWIEPVDRTGSIFPQIFFFDYPVRLLLTTKEHSLLYFVT